VDESFRRAARIAATLSASTASSSSQEADLCFLVVVFNVDLKNMDSPSVGEQIKIVTAISTQVNKMLTITSMEVPKS